MGVIKIRNILFYLILILFSRCHDTNGQFKGVVSSATPEASKVGELIFLKGGNAVDVAVAVSFALGVSEPAMSGLGGGTQILLSINNKPPIAINGTTLSPNSTPAHIKDTLTFHRRSTIPSTVKVLDYIWRNYGSGNLSWEELLNPAIELAENGFKVGKFRAKVFEQYEDKLIESKFNTSYFLINGIRIPRENEILKQPHLAATLKRLAKYGADDFYKGEIAKEIAIDMANQGGWITLKDLASFPEPKELNPLSINLNGYNVFSQPPPCGGWITLLAMNLMNQDLATKNLDQKIIKALYLAHNDRDNNPITDLINYESVANIKLSKKYAQDLLLQDSNLIDKNNNENSGETTHFSVVDSQGNAIAVTSSINAYFGSLSASKKLGFLYNTYMDDFIFENPNHPFAIRPNAMAYSSMSPVIVQKNNENILVIGSPGSSRIISTVAQITAKWIQNKNINYLINQPRIHVYSNYTLFENIKDTNLLDHKFQKEFDIKLKFPSDQMKINDSLNAYYGGVHAIAKEGRIWVGAADPRRDGLSISIEQ
jgi:gamma-glutamyltranspeptidase/glutathione hydrolase